MTLTVPNAGVSAGRAAQPQFEAPEAGAALAQVGQTMLQVGDAIQADRLDRTGLRLTTELQNDMNALRLQTEEIGDPDALDTAWQQGVTELRNQYLGGDGYDGEVRVPPQLQERFAIQFDDLGGRHAYALGARSLELRQSQREATWVEYRHNALNTTAGMNEEVREATVAQATQLIEARVAANVITPEQGQIQILAFEEDMDAARATIMVAEDPAGYLAAVDAGEFSGLGAQTQAQYVAQATRAVASDEREAVTARNGELAELIDVFETGLPAGNAAILDDPAYQALPNYAQAMAARDLAASEGSIRTMRPVDLQTLLAVEREVPITRQWQAERVQLLEDAHAAAVAGWGSDPISYAAEVGITPPEFVEFDPADPTAFSNMIRSRRAFSNALVEEGYSTEARLFSETERLSIQAAAAADQDPAARAALAEILFQGGGIDVVEDPVFRHVGGLASSGVSAELRSEILRGQQVLANDNAVLGSQRERLDAVYTEVAGMFENLPGGEAAQSRIMAAADALYVARLRRSDPGGDFQSLTYRQALHEVMGGTGPVNNSRAARGGVQEYNDVQTVFPRGVNHGDFTAALGALNETFFGYGANDTRTLGTEQAEAVIAQMSQISVGQSPPIIAGRPVPPRELQQFELRAVADDRYVFIYRANGGTRVVTDANGEDYIFSMLALLQATQP